MRERTHKSSGHECSFLNRADDLRRQPNGETKLQALSIPRLIDTAFLILPVRPSRSDRPGGDNSLPQTKVTRHLAAQLCQPSSHDFCFGQGHERAPFKFTDAAFCQRRTLRRRFDQKRRPPNGVIPAVPNTRRVSRAIRLPAHEVARMAIASRDNFIRSIGEVSPHDGRLLHSYWRCPPAVELVALGLEDR